MNNTSVFLLPAAIVIIILIGYVTHLIKKVTDCNNKNYELRKEIASAISIKNILLEEVADFECKLTDADKKYKLLFIKKLKLIVASDPDFYKENIYKNLEDFIKENNYSDLLNVAIVLTKNIDAQIKAIIEVVEKKEGLSSV